VTKKIKIALLVLMASLSTVAFADGHSTLRVVVVQTDDVGAYVAQLSEGKRMIARIDPKMTMRAWQATFSGNTTGSVVVALEYPGSLSEFAVGWEKALADEALTEWLAGLSGLRTIISDSLYNELSL
jgi:hypothetical protein